MRDKTVSFATHNRYDSVTGCWNWTGARIKDGYGTMSYLGRTRLVHRISAHCYLGFDLESDLKVLHRCDNPGCFNPKHLCIGTQADNVRDCAEKGRHWNSPAHKIACIHGHPLVGANLCLTREGKRACRECRRAWGRARWRRLHP